ncbi:unnamed protein product [Parascedosporium putredinis]|uniref:VHS domain-containing protein n=1 Tax=Parascedosporium putredinis TaxID=1442378 RepID=A0A9P1H3S3_9PEZI|nr:unnamed protein product [Parascedosporium putredinis]CAI7996079.1 unnamed protein product [Parascedosporium putredinis]
MFRAAAAGPFDEVVAKATDENLTSEDWGAIITVCDQVSADTNGPKEAVQSIIKRLAHRNANVQLYTLELANALSQNCGKAIHRELSSRAFTDALLKLANDRNTHNQVKVKILERMKEWSDMFKNDPDLGIIPLCPTEEQPDRSRPSKEEDELQMALTLSLQEEERKKKVADSSSAGASSSAAGGSAAGPAQEIKPVPSGTTAATVSRVRLVARIAPRQNRHLPLNYVEKLTDPTADELHREAQMEAEVFAEIKNVEKLLTLLSASNTSPREEDNDEIAKLYHQTTAIRPKLIRLIEKYSQKKDDFTQLNEKFIKARRDYEALLESSMAHPPQPSYRQYMPPGPSQQGYPSQGPPGGAPHDAQRFYTPGPQALHPPLSSGLTRRRPHPSTLPAPISHPSHNTRRIPSDQGPRAARHPGSPARSTRPHLPSGPIYSLLRKPKTGEHLWCAGARYLSVRYAYLPTHQNPLNPAAPYSPDDPYNTPNHGPLSQPTPPANAPPSQAQYQSYNPPQGYDGAPPAPSGAAPPYPKGSKERLPDDLKMPFRLHLGVHTTRATGYPAK